MVVQQPAGHLHEVGSLAYPKPDSPATGESLAAGVLEVSAECSSISLKVVAAVAEEGTEGEDSSGWMTLPNV